MWFIYFKCKLLTCYYIKTNYQWQSLPYASFIHWQNKNVISKYIYLTIFPFYKHFHGSSCTPLWPSGSVKIHDTATWQTNRSPVKAGVCLVSSSFFAHFLLQMLRNCFSFPLCPAVVCLSHMCQGMGLNEGLDWLYLKNYQSN